MAAMWCGAELEASAIKRRSGFLRQRSLQCKRYLMVARSRHGIFGLGTALSATSNRIANSQRNASGIEVSIAPRVSQPLIVVPRERLR